MANELELMAAHIIWKMVVISVSWKEFQKIDGWVDSTPTHKTHVCSTVCSQARTAQLMRLAQELHCHHCAPKQVLSSRVTHVSSLLPHTENTQLHPAHLPAPSVDKLRHREDLQSGHNNSHRLWAQSTCEHLENRSIFRRSTSIFLMYRKILEKKITDLLSPKKWRNLEKLGRLVCRILNYQRRPTSNRRCISTIPWNALQTLMSKMESYRRCWLHHCVPRKLRGPRCIVLVWTGKPDQEFCFQKR